MSKISLLPELQEPNGSERLPVVRDGETFGAALGPLAEHACAPFVAAAQAAAARFTPGAAWKPRFRLVNDAGNIVLELAADDVPNLKAAVAALTSALSAGSLVTGSASWRPRARLVNTAGNVLWDSAVLEKQVATIVPLATPRIGNGVAVLGDSRSEGVVSGRFAGGVQPINWANALTGHRLRIMAALGVSGDRSDQIAARVPQAIASGAGIGYILCGVNDLAQGVTGAACAANIIAMADQLRAAGMRVVLECEVGSGNFSAAQIAQLIELNLRLYWYARSAPGVLLHDARPAVMEPTAGASALAYRTGYAGDVTHPNQRGAQAWGRSLAAALSPLLGTIALPFPAERADAPVNGRWQLVRNGLFLDTSGGTLGANASGTVPQYWEARADSGATIAVSSAASPGVLGNRVTSSATFGAVGQRARFVTDIGSANFAPGDLIQPFVEVTITDATALSSLYLMLEHNTGGGGGAINSGAFYEPSRAGQPGPIAGDKLVLTTPAYTVQAAAGAGPYMLMSINAEARAAGAAAFAVDRAALVRIPQ